MWTEYLKVSFLMMRAKPVRTFLSLLGIFIGVLALVMILSIREGMRRKLLETYSLKGVSGLFVHPGFDPVARRMGRLGPDEIDRLRQTRGVRAVWPRLTSEMEVRGATVETKLTAVGIDDQFSSVYRLPMVRGRTVLAEEVARRAAVCILTTESVRKLFPRSEPIGASVEINGRSFEIIGVAQWTPEVQFRAGSLDADLFLPITILGDGVNNIVPMLEIRMDPTMGSETGKRLVQEALTRGETSRDGMYYIRSLDEMVERRKAVDNRTMLGLLGIAAISLLVGGIGVANVMITSVTERTREVGIRKALGARREDILLQFLVESGLLCASGGILAAVIGALAASLLPTLLNDPIPMEIPGLELGACVLLTLLIGLIAGVYPASRAAAMPAAEALRHE